jgi:hypothetical protein
MIHVFLIVVKRTAGWPLLAYLDDYRARCGFLYYGIIALMGSKETPFSPRSEKERYGEE